MNIRTKYQLVNLLDVRKPNVFYALEVLTGVGFVIHRLPLDEKAAFDFGHAVNALQLVPHHPHLLQIVDSWSTEAHLFVVSPYIPTMTLKRAMRERTCIPQGTIRRYMYQLLSAVSHLRSKGVLHRHIQPSSIFLQDAQNLGNQRLIPGGLKLSRRVQAYQVNMLDAHYSPLRSPGSRGLHYLAPEILLGQTEYTEPVAYSYPADIWSCGCVLAALVTGNDLFPGDSLRTKLGQLYSIFSVVGSPSPADWPGVELLPGWSNLFPQWNALDLGTVVHRLPPAGVDLSTRMVTLNPSDRPTVDECLEHVYLRNQVLAIQH